MQALILLIKNENFVTVILPQSLNDLQIVISVSLEQNDFFVI